MVFLVLEIQRTIIECHLILIHFIFIRWNLVFAIAVLIGASQILSWNVLSMAAGVCFSYSFFPIFLLFSLHIFDLYKDFSLNKTINNANISFVRQYFVDYKLLVNGTETAWYRVHFENWLANDNTVFLVLCNVANLFVPIASSLQSTEGYQSFG